MKGYEDVLDLFYAVKQGATISFEVVSETGVVNLVSLDQYGWSYFLGTDENGVPNNPITLHFNGSDALLNEVLLELKDCNPKVL